MKSFLRSLKGASFAVIGAVIASAAHAAEVDLQTKIGLQQTLDSYVEANSLDGQMTLIDVKAKSMTQVYMSSPHPMIVPLADGQYFLCADGYDAAGNEVKLDFLVQSNAGNFIIVDTILNGREEIKTIMKGQ